MSDPEPSAPPDASSDRRLRLFAFTQADHRHRYMAILARFDEARDRSRLQLSPSDLVGDEPLPTTEGDALGALDQLYGWGMLERLQDDRRVRTIAEYRQRRSVYQMTELGLVAWSSVGAVLKAQAGEAELRRLVLTLIGLDLQHLAEALDASDAEQVGMLLGRLHDTLSALAKHAARFTLATSELASTWEIDPAAFLDHKRRLLGHLDGFLQALTAHHPQLAAQTLALDARSDALVDLAVAASTSLGSVEATRQRVTRHWQGVVAWFVERPGQPSEVTKLGERTNRAIRDLVVLLRRVIDRNAGGVSRGTQLELLAGWVAACPGDTEAAALIAATSGLQRARHFGTPDVDLDKTEPNESWWEASPAPVDLKLRRSGKVSSPGRPHALRDRKRERELLRLHQQARRAQREESEHGLVEALDLPRPLDAGELAVLLRLLSRALHSRAAVATTATTARGRLHLRLEPADTSTRVPTCRGWLHIEGRRLVVRVSAVAPAAVSARESSDAQQAGPQ
jgi:uncharacterized protein (TIGR02677 family)